MDRPGQAALRLPRLQVRQSSAHMLILGQKRSRFLAVRIDLLSPRRDEGSSVSAVLSTITSILLVTQLLVNIVNSNNNENNKNENNQNNNNNNNLNSYDNIFVSMNENDAAASMSMMLGR